MRRSDRHDSSYDNSVNNPQSRRREPLSPHELERLLATVRSQRDEAQHQAKETQQEAEQFKTLYQEEEQQRQKAVVLYQEAHSQAQSYLSLYNNEKTRAIALQTQYESAVAEREHYLTLYTESQEQLKLERRSKAGIKGWETRRKKENERLKQEIAAMTVLLRDSLARKDEAINHLDELAERMDRIQGLVNGVEEETDNNPLSLLQKFKRMWVAIKEILAE